MKRIVTFVLTGLLISAALIPAASAQDASADEQRWFQIEVFVFANSDPATELSEQWPDDLGLQYPARLYQLLDQHTENTLIENSGTQDLDGNAADGEPELMSNAPTSPSPEQATSFSQFDASTTDAEYPDTQAMLLEDQGMEDGPKAFVKLPAEQLQLTDIVERISRRSNYRFLMHDSWLQPVQDRDTSIPILIRAGEKFDDHFELEGSIKISVERYLHISTDLWLSRFVNKTSAEELLWPVLPKQPNTILNAPPEDSTSPLLVSMDGSASTDAGNSFVSGDLSFSGLRQSSTDPASDSNTLAEVLDNSFQSYDSFFDFKQRYYRAERTATMRQSRRMRSNELHYIDHPLMGLLIKIMPYEPAPQALESESPGGL